MKKHSSCAVPPGKDGITICRTDFLGEARAPLMKNLFPLFNAFGFFACLMAPVSLFAQKFPAVVIWSEPGLPAADSPAPTSAQLSQIFPEARLVSTDQLASQLNDPQTRLLILPQGSVVPESAWSAILDCLHRGTNLLVLGGRPFTRSAYRDTAGWHLRDYAVRFIRPLLIDQYQATPGSAGAEFTPNPAFPLLFFRSITYLPTSTAGAGFFSPPNLQAIFIHHLIPRSFYAFSPTAPSKAHCSFPFVRPFRFACPANPSNSKPPFILPPSPPLRGAYRSAFFWKTSRRKNKPPPFLCRPALQLFCRPPPQKACTSSRLACSEAPLYAPSIIPPFGFVMKPTSAPALILASIPITSPSIESPSPLSAPPICPAKFSASISTIRTSTSGIATFLSSTPPASICFVPAGGPAGTSSAINRAAPTSAPCARSKRIS